MIKTQRKIQCGGERVMATELKPCPFCGGKAGQYQDYLGFWHVQCDKCGIGTLKNATKESATRAWNRRIKDGSL